LHKKVLFIIINGTMADSVSVPSETVIFDL